MRRVNQILGITSQQYENLYLNNYLHWCESVALDVLEVQKVISSSAIARWYAAEYEKCEAEFLRLIGRYENSTTVTDEDKQVCYTDCTFKIMSIAPRPLVQIAKRPDQPKQMPQPRVRGIKLFSYN